MDEALQKIRSSLGEIPILESEQRAKEEGAEESLGEAKSGSPTTKSAPKVLADGTYATETVFSTKSPVAGSFSKSHRPPLRCMFFTIQFTMKALLLLGDYFLASVLATTLTKLALRYSDLATDQSRAHAVKSEAMLIMTSIIRVGKSEFTTTPIDEDSLDRILMCLRALSNPLDDQTIKAVFLEKCRSAFAVLIHEQDVCWI